MNYLGMLNVSVINHSKKMKRFMFSQKFSIFRFQNESPFPGLK